MVRLNRVNEWLIDVIIVNAVVPYFHYGFAGKYLAKLDSVGVSLNLTSVKNSVQVAIKYKAYVTKVLIKAIELAIFGM